MKTRVFKPFLAVAIFGFQKIENINFKSFDQIHLILNFNHINWTDFEKNLNILSSKSQLPIYLKLVFDNESFYRNFEFTKLINKLPYLQTLLQINGLIFGSLNSNYEIDEFQLQELIFHKIRLKLIYNQNLAYRTNYQQQFLILKKYLDEFEFILTDGSNENNHSILINLNWAKSFFSSKLMYQTKNDLSFVKPLYLQLKIMNFQLQLSTNTELSISQELINLTNYIERLERLY